MREGYRRYWTTVYLNNGVTGRLATDHYTVTGMGCWREADSDGRADLEQGALSPDAVFPARMRQAIGATLNYPRQTLRSLLVGDECAR